MAVALKGLVGRVGWPPTPDQKNHVNYSQPPTSDPAAARRALRFASSSSRAPAPACPGAIEPDGASPSDPLGASAAVAGAAAAPAVAAAALAPLLPPSPLGVARPALAVVLPLLGAASGGGEGAAAAAAAPVAVGLVAAPAAFSVAAAGPVATAAGCGGAVCCCGPGLWVWGAVCVDVNDTLVPKRRKGKTAVAQLDRPGAHAVR